MNFQQLATTEFGTRAWLAMGSIPPRPGHALARWLTRRLYRHKQGVVYRIQYANQRRVLGPYATHEQIDLAVEAVLRHAGRTNYDLIRAISRGEQAVIESIDLGQDLWSDMDYARRSGSGVLLCGVHLSNFNLGFLSFALQGNTTIQALSAPVRAGGFDVVHNLRNKGAFEDTPIDAPSLRKAINRLKAGGLVLIGVDWPIPGTGDCLPFFGETSLLSSSYMRLALSTNALLLPISARWTSERGYYLITDPLIELVRTGDKEQDARANALRVLAIAERWIRETPDQWLMHHPVWPDSEGERPIPRLESRSDLR